VSRTLFDGRYEILGRLGGGGMAEVYLARDEHLGRDVALKILKERLAEDEVFLKRFRREAKNAATLNHPNVVQIYDQRDSGDGSCYIAMEYVPGGTLKQRIAREGALDPAEATRLALQVAEALRASHARGVVHRDVKSQNVLLDAAGDVKVADFGIARAADTTTLSGPNAVLGTAKYMSPEQASGSVATPRSDLYSLGIVLYEMLTGELPYRASDLAQARTEHAAGPPPRPRDANPGVPEAMDALVARLMARDPDLRLGTAAELVEELRRTQDRPRPAALERPLVPQRTPSPPTPAPRAADPKQRRRRPGWLLAALAALLVLLGVLAWGLGPGTVGRDASGVVGDLADRARGALAGAGRALGGPEEVSVPDVEGMTRSEARERLSAAGLGARTHSRESPEEKAGRVLEQSVPGGREVEEGSKILLAVGEGRPSTGTPGDAPREEARNESVPDLVGLTYPEAEEALQAAGFVLGGVREVPSETIPAGVIVRQEPRAGSAATAGAPVFLTTSTGTTGAPTSASPSATASPSAPP
jgi:eukaryotic-like serine/threonine-protein kinase